MAYSNFIAAIDLGTSHLVGMVGTKSAAGTLSIIACEIENSANCIRRGCVYNVDETASRVKRLISRLENKLGGSKIEKVYVGIGGQSLHSIDHSVLKVLGNDVQVTDEVINELYDESMSFQPDMKDVLAAVSPSYLLDDRPERNPAGIPCNQIEACYKLIVGRPSLRRYVVSSIKDKATINIAGLTVSPLALADVVLSNDEKELGCALIGFGAGVTTLNVYKGGKLVHLSVIPLGSHLITKDITSLHMVETEAERIKLAYGSAIMDKDDNTNIQVSSADGDGLRDIELADLNMIIEARMKEILENVYARLRESGAIDSLGAGIIITGGGAALRNLPSVIQENLKIDVRYSGVRKGIIVGNEAIANSPEYTVVIGLLMQGTENCAGITIAPSTGSTSTTLFPEMESTPPVQNQDPNPNPNPVPKKKKGSLFKSLSSKIDDLGKTLFDDEPRSK